MTITLTTDEQIILAAIINETIAELREAKRTWGTSDEDKDMDFFFDERIQNYTILRDKIII